MSGWNDAELMRMQEAAIKRVSRMQQRSMATVAETNARYYGDQPPLTVPYTPVEPQQPQSRPQQQVRNQNPQPQNSQPVLQSRQKNPQPQSPPGQQPKPPAPQRQNGHFYAPQSPPAGGFQGANGPRQNANASVQPPPENQNQQRPQQGAGNPISNLLGSFGFGQGQSHGQQGGGMINRIISGLSNHQAGGPGLIESLGGAISSTIDSVSSPVSKVLEALHIDNERLVILVVMLLVLNEEETDKTLLLALGYLLF